MSTLSMSRNGTAARGRRSPTISFSRRRGRSLVLPVPAAPASSPSGLGAAGILARGGGGDADTAIMPPNLHLNTHTNAYGGYGLGDTPPVSAGTTASGNLVYGSYGVVLGPPPRPGMARRDTFDERRKDREYERARRNSAAEKSLEQVRRGIDFAVGAGSTTTSPHANRFPRVPYGPPDPSGLTLNYNRTTRDHEERRRRLSLQQPISPHLSNQTSPNRHSAVPTMASLSNVGLISSASKATTGMSGTVGEAKSNSYGESGSGAATPTPMASALYRNFVNNRLSRSPSTTAMNAPQLHELGYPERLRTLLDGTRHTDELGVMFEAGWPLMEQWLIAIGGGKGDGDFGRVALIVR